MKYVLSSSQDYLSNPEVIDPPIVDHTLTKKEHMSNST